MPQTTKSRGALKEALAFLWCLLPAAAGLLLIRLSRLSPAATEAVYSRRVFPVVSAVLSVPARFLPFSFVAVLIWSIPPLAVFLLALPLVQMRRTRDKRRFLLRYSKGILLIPVLIFFVFAISCAPNFARLTFAEQSGLAIRPSTAKELASLCYELIGRTNEARAAVQEENGVFAAGEDFRTLSQASLGAFNALEADYPFLRRVAVAPKAMLGSEALSYLEVTGFYSCFTSEPNVNVHMPDLELPFTMCHELAHTSGMMREDEANFIGYLACERSELASMRYSGLICALNYSMGQLYAASPALYWELRNLYSEGVERDLADSNAYWEPYSKTVSTQVYSAVNDAMLKLNDQTDGRRSYGRMVDLLLADYRARHGLA